MKHVLFLAILVGCGGTSNAFEANPNEGNKGGPCYPNSTCNPGLVCVASVCGESGADSAVDSPSTDTSVTDTGVTVTDTGMVVVTDAPAEAAADTPISLSYTTSMISAACEDVGDAAEIPAVNGDDVASDRISLPFAFKLFGDAVNQYTMASNGFLQLWASGSGGISKRADNVAIPSADDPNGIVAPFWDDLVPMFSQSRVGLRGSAPNRRIVVSWGHWTIKGDTGTRISFQAKLFETTNVIELHYCAMTPEGNARATGSSATIGLENLGGTKGIQQSFNTAGTAVTGKAFRYTP